MIRRAYCLQIRNIVTSQSRGMAILVLHIPMPQTNSLNQTEAAIFLLNLMDASTGSLLVCYQIILKYTLADVTACVAAVKKQRVDLLRQSAVFFFYSLL